MDYTFEFLSGEALGRASSQPGYHVRMLDPKGIYPPGIFTTRQGSYHADEQLAFLITWSSPWRSPDDDLPYTEMDWVSPEELRLLGSILLCESFDGSKIRLYPARYPLRLKARELDLTNTRVITSLKAFLVSRGKQPTLHSVEYQISACLTHSGSASQARLRVG